MSTIERPVLIFNAHVSFAQTAEAQRPKIDIPDPVIDLFKADVFADTEGGDIDPAAIPPNAPVGAPSPTKPSSPSRTSGCSRSCRRRTAH
jgi:hypothetical protein